MCRWLAYSGTPIPIEDLLYRPANSLARQSLSAQRCAAPTNGDGFGLGWYGELDEPGLYRDTMPAWNDANLRSLARQIRSRLFVAHVRASTGTATTRLNCHPFRWGRWLFMHNGQVGGYLALKRDIEMLIPTPLYACREGSTDSEALFYALLGNGLEADPAQAFARTLAQVESIMERHGATEPLRFTASVTDGETIWAVRYASDGKAPTLFHASGGRPTVDDGRVRFEPGCCSLLVLSEPLDAVVGAWTEVPESSLLVARHGRIEVVPFAPAVAEAA